MTTAQEKRAEFLKSTECRDETFIRGWLNKINETDEAIIYETITAMRTSQEYRKFIIDYANTAIDK